MKEIARPYPNVRVIVAPVSVASLLTRQHVKAIIQHDLEQEHSSGILVVPGSVQWDLNAVNEEFDVLVVKGPGNVEALGKFLSNIIRIAEKSLHLDASEIKHLIETSKPSRESDIARFKQVIEERRALLSSFRLGKKAGDLRATNPENDRSTIELLKNPARNFTLEGGTLFIGQDFPPVVMAEIINAPGMHDEEIDKWAQYFTREGADIIDVGATAGLESASRLGDITNFLVHERKVHVSIDSLNEKEIVAAVDNGAEMILSIDDGNKEVLDSLSKDVAIVIIPTNVKKGVFPRTTREIIDSLRSIVDFALARGYTRIVVDPILNSPIKPGLAGSIDAFVAFRNLSRDDPRLDLPLFIGGSNVSEMIDTDSSGVNALLAVIGVELGAGILFTSEDSAKTLGSVAELRAARDMASFARLAKSFPKDGPFTAFGCKQKHRGLHSFEIPAGEGGVPVTDVAVSPDPRSFRMDELGVYFKIFVDAFTGHVIVGVFEKQQLISIFRGTSTETIGKTILNQYPGLAPMHVLYLGRELARAEAALRHHAVYIQDEN